MGSMHKTINFLITMFSLGNMSISSTKTYQQRCDLYVNTLNISNIRTVKLNKIFNLIIAQKFKKKFQIMLTFIF